MHLNWVLVASLLARTTRMRAIIDIKIKMPNSLEQNLIHPTLMKNAALIHIGTSGWHYPHWQGSFYPQELAKKDWLAYYAQHFHTVEINNSFYKLPAPETLQQWRDIVPDDFVFSLKASQYITHKKKLKDAQATVSNLLERVNELGEQLDVILFQLPPRWHCNPQRLRDCLAALDPEYRYAFEFRDRTWHNSQVYDILAEHGVAFCIYDLGGYLSPKEVTADFVYLRLHGPQGDYQGQYDSQTLARWAEAFSTWTKEGRDVYCYFDNDEHGYAAQDALRLQDMVKADS